MRFAEGSASLFSVGQTVRVRKQLVRRIPRPWAADFLLFVWLFAVAVLPVSAQQPAARPSPNQPQPVSLPHLYWHFLVYQNVLDTTAANREARGRGGSWLRNDLQTKMGFSDAEFAPIRASSQRLSSELKVLDAQAATIRASSASAAKNAQLKALIAQREAYINEEILTLKMALPPERIAAFEAFITQFFAPKKLTYQMPAAQTNQ